MHLSPPQLISELRRRLLRGEHLSLLGPRGSGKSTLLAVLHSRLVIAGIPCAYSNVTTSLDHITRALQRAYPGVRVAGITRRAARSRLWDAADKSAGVLLLDHFSSVSNAMVFLLKRLHGGVMGVLTVVDIEVGRDRSRMRRPSRYGAMCIRMPLTPTRQLRRLLYEPRGGLALPPLAPSIVRELVQAARGRPGWIVKCTELARESRYWCKHGLLVRTLCVDTEAAVRHCALDLVRPATSELDYPIDSGQSRTEGGSETSGLITPKQAGV